MINEALSRPALAFPARAAGLFFILKKMKFTDGLGKKKSNFAINNHKTMAAKYINPFTDFGFKKIFGEEASKPLLIDFLNALLPEEGKITELTFKNTEQLGDSRIERKAIFDIYCENERGEKFIVEMQKTKQDSFKERSLYYSTFPIREQAEAGQVWNYGLKGIYCIGLLDFVFDDYYFGEEEDEGLHIIELKNQRGKVFYNKLAFIYLELPNFKKEENQLVTRLDKWFYFIKHLKDLQAIPAMLKEEVFVQAFAKAEIAALGAKEFDAYEMSMKAIREHASTMDYAKKEGKIEGKMETAMNMIREGDTAEKIIRCTGLTKEQIEKLRNELSSNGGFKSQMQLLGLGLLIG